MKSVILLCLMVAVCSAELTVNVEDTWVLVGETATIPCTYDSDSDVEAEFTWSRIVDGEAERLYVFTIKDGEAAITLSPPDSVQREGLELTPDGLVFKNAQLKDNNDFSTLRCGVSLDRVGSKEKDVKFDVFLLPTDKPTMSISPYNEGQTGFTISEAFPTNVGSCESAPSFPAAEITFYKGSQDGVNFAPVGSGGLDEILNAGDTEAGPDGISIKTSKDLYKTLDKSDHQAEFTCSIKTVYKDQVYEKNYTMPKFNVNYQTEMVKFVDRPVAYLDTTITLACEADGWPEPRMTLNTSSTGSMELTITKEMNGKTYYCSAFNNPDQLPVVSEPYTIEVLNLDEPVFKGIELVDGTVEISELGTLSVKCSATGNPAPEVAWYKGDDKLSDDGTLMIEEVKFENSGDYSCRATNGHDTLDRSKSFELQVTGLRRVGDEKTDVEGKKDDSVILDCVVEANPDPTFSWEIDVDDASLDEVNLIKDGKTQFTSQLTIGPLSTDLSEKTVVCTAKNANGNVKKEFKLPVVAAGAGSTTVIIIVVLLLILIIAIVLAVLYNKGIICKKQEKGEESAEGDIAVEINNDDDVEAGNGKVETAANGDEEAPPENVEEEKLLDGENREE